MYQKTFSLFNFLFVFSILSNAQTGIGTTTPVNKFEVVATAADPASSNSSANGNLRLGNSSAVHVLDFGLSSSSTYSWLQARSKSNYATNYNLVLNPNGGRVGIGNSSPSQALDVTGTGRFSTGIINNGSRTFFGKDGANMHWFSTSDNTTEPSSLAYGFESNGTSIQSHKWYIGGSEKMQLTSSGKVGIGTSTPSAGLQLQNANVFSGSDDPANNSVPSLYIYNNSNSSTNAHAISLVRTGGSSGGKPYYSLDVAGVFGYSMGINNPSNQLIINTTWNFNTGSSNNAIIINKSGQSRVGIPAENGALADSWPSGWGGGLVTYDFACAGIYYQTLTARSDRRLKNTIVDLDSISITKYLQLRPVNYYWNDGSDNHHKQFGLIAQEVEQLFPDMVSTANDSMQTKSINYQALHALSLKVIQSQQTEIESLKKKQADMEERLLKLEAKLNK